MSTQAKLRMESGHPVTNDAVKLEGDLVRFIAEDGNAMFEARVLDDRSIEIRSVSMCRVAGYLHDDRLNIEPRSSNSIFVTTPIY